MKRGLVIGKFYPPHLGHYFLIEYALRHSSSLDVLVCDGKNQVLPAAMRASWIQTAFPRAKVSVIPDINDDENSGRWAEHTVNFLGYVPQIVFTSEDYGDAYAKCMDAKHTLVDRGRKKVPISATKIREHPEKYWSYLMPGARAALVRRIALVGAESTGTTTLTEDLARHFKTAWVPEFGRFYSLGKVSSASEWESSEFEFIARIQNDWEDALAERANLFLFCDTNSWATSIWHERYMGTWSKKVEALSYSRQYDLYILTGDEIPFVQDGLRDGKHVRHAMHNRFLALLKKHKYPHIIVHGSRSERLKKAIKACHELTVHQPLFPSVPGEHSVK